MSIYKYIPEEHAESFVRRGAVLFRSLSYFRDFEDEQVRGDEFEGTKRYRPDHGLEITLTSSQQKSVLPHTFESTVNEADIFVFCLSTVLSHELSERFKSKICIEIEKPGIFIGRIRSALSRRPSVKDKLLVHGQVHYYELDEPPIVDWALPEKIAMSKDSAFSWQEEYRVTFAVNDAFRVENTRLSLVAPGQERVRKPAPHLDKLLKIGRVADICKVHHFG